MNSYEKQILALIMLVMVAGMAIGYCLGAGDADIKCREGLKTFYVEKN